MSEAIMVTLNTILFLEDIYPRIKVDDDRIKYFVELITNGKEPPPLFLAKYDQPGDGRQYVLLDGKHRTEAYTFLGVRDVPACIFDIPRKHWRLKSAGFNAVASKPLSSDDMKRAIIDAWTKDGIRDVHEIAELIENAWTPRHINRVLKPLRDQEREELQARVRELRGKGLTQAEIAKEVGMSQGWVSDTLQWISISSQKGDERLELLDRGRIQPPTGAEMFHVPVKTGGDGKGRISNVTAFPESPSQTGPPGEIQPDENSKTNQAMPVQKGETRSQWRRHLKEPPTKEIRAVYSDANILRGWIADIKRGSYDKVTITLFHECSRKVMTLGNELHLAMREFLEMLKREPGRMAAGITDDYHAEIDAAVNKFMARNWSRIQRMPEEDRKDLKMECFVAALEARGTWDGGTRSSIETWIGNNLDWKFKKLATKEYRRIETIAEYRRHVEMGMGANRSRPR